MFIYLLPNNTYIYLPGSQKMLCHAFNDDLEEETRVFQQVVHKNEISVGRSQGYSQVLTQLFMNRLFTGFWGHKNILQKAINQYKHDKLIDN